MRRRTSLTWATVDIAIAGLAALVMGVGPPPPADLVTILNPSSGYSYPSGHAILFTWLSFMLATAIAPHVGRRARSVVRLLAAIVIVFACIGRVWAGAHWPTDAIGGFLLGIGWSAFILWLPERWLPTASRRWIPARWFSSRVTETSPRHP